MILFCKVRVCVANKGEVSEGRGEYNILKCACLLLIFGRGGRGGRGERQCGGAETEESPSQKRA